MAHGVEHETTQPLVDAGNAAGSWLHTIVSSCAPAPGVTPMPRNASNLLEPGLVAMIRDWIDAGAADD